MSRSRKKNAAGGCTCSTSEKKDKRLANRAFRRYSKMVISQFEFDKLPFKIREIVDVWSMNKDGKCWWGENLPNYFYRK